MQSNAQPGLTVVGLGPGTWENLTIEAAEVLQQTSEVYVRTAVQPSLAPIGNHLPGVTIHSFDHLYDTLPSLEAVYEAIADQVERLARRPEGVVYAVPGSPSIGETTVRLLRERLAQSDIPVRLIKGISYVEPVIATAGASDPSWIQVIDASEASLMASENAVGEVSGETSRLPWRAPVPTAPLIISHLYERHMASGVKLWLGRYYPNSHPIKIIPTGGDSQTACEEVALHELDRIGTIDHSTALYVPPLSDDDNVRTFAGIMNLTRTLRAPGGCPWDREQTHASLKPHLLEEAYEALDALDSGDPDALCEELGDLLFQITIHSQVAAESGEFTIEDVIQGVTSKLIGRHPHVYGEMQLGSAQDVLHAWESFKQREKPKRASVLEQIPKGLPALPQSNLMQKRASGVGFEWAALAEVIAKVEEELAELQREVDRQSPKDLQREEFGDILFALVSVGRHLKLDPEEALRLANRKFAARFQYVEARVAASGRSLRDLTSSELDALWEEAKDLGTHIQTGGDNDD